MSRTLRNTFSVAVVTAMTALAIFSAVQVTGRIVNLPTTATAAFARTVTTTDGGAVSSIDGSTSSSVQTCPATGCTATSCHATGGRH